MADNIQFDQGALTQKSKPLAERPGSNMGHISPAKWARYAAVALKNAGLSQFEQESQLDDEIVREYTLLFFPTNYSATIGQYPTRNDLPFNSA